MVSAARAQGQGSAGDSLFAADFYASLTESLADAITTQQVADVALEVARTLLGVEYATVMLLDAERRAVSFLRLLPVPAEVARLMAQIPPGATSPPVEVLNTHRAIFHGTREQYLADYPHLRAATEALDVEALVNLPLMAAGQALGLISLSWVDPRQFDEDERRFLGAFAGELAVAFHRASLFEQKDQITSLLQRAVLPESLPHYEDIELAARYLPAESGIEVGGDWYDAFVAPDGSLWLSVGDVGGHGTEAATLMGELRHAARGAAFAGLDPAGALDVIDRLVVATTDGLVATAVIVRVDGTSGRLTWANAGHLPPLFLPAQGEGRLLEDRLGALLGLGDAGRTHSEIQLDPGGALILYTDGLVENRGEDLTVGMGRLLDGLEGHAETWGAELLADRTLAISLAGTERLDDLCVLVAYRR